MADDGTELNYDFSFLRDLLRIYEVPFPAISGVVEINVLSNATARRPCSF